MHLRADSADHGAGMFADQELSKCKEPERGRSVAKRSDCERD
jgi:hypothetical protein